MTIDFELEDTISGNKAPLMNLDENMALESLFDKLEQNGFGPFSELNSNAAIVVSPADGEDITHPWDDDFLKFPLHKLNFTDGCRVTIDVKNKVA